MQKFFFIGLLLLSFVAASQNIDQLLQQAQDSKLSGNSDQLSQTITQLQSLEHQFTAEQRCAFDYLRIYQRQVLTVQWLNAISAYQQLLNRCQHSEQQIEILISLSSIQMIAKQYIDSLSNLDRALQLSKQLKGNDVLRHKVFINASNVYYQLGKYQLMLELSELILRAKNVNPIDQCRAKTYKALALIALKQAPAATAVEQTTNFCQKFNENSYALLLKVIYFSYQLTQAENQAERLSKLAQLQQLQAEVAQISYKNISHIYAETMAQAYLQTGQLELAKQTAEQLLQNTAGQGDTEPRLQALNVLLKVALKQSNQTQIAEYLQQKESLQKRLQQQRQEQQIAYLTVRHNNEVQEQQMANLEKDNKLLTLKHQIIEQQSINQKLSILILSVLLVGIALLLFIIIRKQKQLKQMAEQDFLTKVLNRKGLEKYFNATLKHCAANNIPVYLAIMDLDHFKKVNDQYGHLTGDWILKHVTRKCRSQLEKGELFGRLGGEEFALLFHGKNTAKIERKIDSIKQSIEFLDCSGSGYPIRTTASFGVATATTKGYNLSLLLTQADTALYQAKDSGRNCVIYYSEASAKPKKQPH